MWSLCDHLGPGLVIAFGGSRVIPRAAESSVEEAALTVVALSAGFHPSGLPLLGAGYWRVVGLGNEVTAGVWSPGQSRLR